VLLLEQIVMAALSFAFLFLPHALAGEGQKSHAQLVIDVIDGQVVPRFKELEAATQRLASEFKGLCAKPNEGAARASVDASLKATVRAWGALDFLRFGPMTEASRLERFYFWPDPRGFTARQLAALLARRDPALLNGRALAAQSAAVQGLSALELILYDDKAPVAGDSEDARYHCAFAAAIADNLAAIGADLVTGWTAPQGWRSKMLAPGSDNPFYKDASETAREVVKALLIGLQLAQDREIVPRLDAATAGPSKPLRLPFERSHLSIDYLESGLRSLHAMFDATGLIAYAPPDKQWMKEFMTRSFDSLLAGAPGLARFDGERRADAEMLTLLRQMRFHLNGLRQVINRELAPAANLVLGFNELDGD
jgi:predicted lipoprotein